MSFVQGYAMCTTGKRLLWLSHPGHDQRLLLLTSRDYRLAKKFLIYRLSEEFGKLRLSRFGRRPFLIQGAQDEHGDVTCGGLVLQDLADGQSAQVREHQV